MWPFLCALLLSTSPDLPGSLPDAPGSPMVKPAFHVKARILPGHRLEGELSMDLEKPGDVLFSLYPNRLEKLPKITSDINKFRIYPRRFDPGRMDILDATCGGKPLPYAYRPAGDIGRARLVIAGEKHGKCSLRIRFRVKIPERFGPFGCMEGRCVLGAPWYPVPLPDAGADYTPVQEHEVSVQGPGRFFLDGMHEKYGEARGTRAFFPLYWGQANWTCKNRVCLLHHSPLQHWTDIVTGNRLGDVLDFARDFMDHMFPGYAKTLVLVETDLREELAMALPGRQMLVAHNALRVMNVDYFQTFHRQKLALTLAETLFLDETAPRERARDLAWVPLMLAHGFLSRPKTVDVLLRPLQWIPQIDVMRKNPRMEFMDAYLAGPHNMDRFRDDFRRWDNDLPRGEEVYHRLLDEFGAIETRRILEKYRTGKKPFRETLDAHVGASMDGFFRRWVDETQPVALSVGRVRRDPAIPGRYRIEIWQNPPARNVVDVEIRTARETVRTIRVELTGAVHTLTADLDSPPVRVEVDPRERILEPENRGPLYARHDNVWPDPGWRFIFSGFEALFNITELWSRLAVDVDFLPDRSLRRRINILALRNEYLAGGLALAHLYYFGPRVSNSRLKYRWDAGIEGDRTHPVASQEDGAEPSCAWTASLFSRWVVNDRLDHMFPSTGGWGILELRHAWFFPDDPALETTRQIRLTGVYTRYFGLPLGMTAALQSQFGFLYGAVHHDTEMLHLTGPAMVQGHPADAFPGRAYLLGAGELRQILMPRLDLTLGSLVYVTRVTGALYLGGGWIAGTADGAWSENSREAVGMGIALRIHGLWFGLYEAILNLQAAFPLHPWPGGSFSPIFFISLEPLL